MLLKQREVFVNAIRSDLIWSSLRHYFYNSFSKVESIGGDEIQFMNYGYSSSSLKMPFDLENNDLQDRDFAMLYYQVMENIPIRGKNVVEIGGGRGGGASFISRYFNPNFVTVIEKSSKAVDLMRQRHQGLNIHHITADAADTKLQASCCDIVINVESSDCYPSRLNFYRECNRILVEGGLLLSTDFVRASEYDSIGKQIQKSSFEILEFEDITPFVLASLRENMGRKMNYIKDGKNSFWIFKSNLVQEILKNMFVTSIESDNYKLLEQKEERYFKLVAKKING